MFDYLHVGAETHLGSGVISAFVFPSTESAQASCFDDCWWYSSQERPTKILTILPWLLSCTDTYMYMPKPTLVVKLNNFWFPSGHHCLLNSKSMVVTCHVCQYWNEV